MKEITVRADIKNIPTITELVDKELEALDCEMSAQIKLDIAIDELASNISYYAYGEEGGDITVRFEFDEENRRVALTFIDSGIPYNPLEKADPDINAVISDDKIGGFGIFMVKKSMDDLIYRFESGKNIFKIIKKI